jgi:hypothetical protein
MSPDQYRQQAALLRAKARAEDSPCVKVELENFAKCYLELARHSEKKADSSQPVRKI